MNSGDPLADEPFSFTETKSGLVQISYRGRLVTSLAGKDASRFLRKLAPMDTRGAQLAMAKATGHFKQGNERMSKNRER